MMIIKLLLSALMLGFFGNLLRAASEIVAKPPVATAIATFNVREYGARGDGHTLDTAAINQAIEACAKAGGGVVAFPPGNYLSGTIRLKSHLTLLLNTGATLTGCTNLDLYQSFTPPAGTPEARFRSTWHRALILGEEVENAAIAGPGVINGNKVFDPRGEERMRGPHTILLGKCREVMLRDFSVKDAANYAVMLEDCQQVVARNLRITGGWDGVHFRGWPDRPCRDVTITGCQFYTGDDAIAGRYWENVLISDCLINSACNGIRLIGPATHLIIHNCLFYGPAVHPHRTSNRYNMLAGINLQPGAWDATQGNLDDVLISDITLHNVATPFQFTLKPGNTAGQITVNRLAATGVYRAAASVESWAAAPFTNVVLRDVSMEFQGGGMVNNARATVKAPGVDARPLPAWGFFARNIKRLTFENVRLSFLADDLRPVMIGDGLDSLILNGFKFSQAGGALPALTLTNVTQLQLRDTGLPVIVPEVVGLKPMADQFAAGRPCPIRVEVVNPGPSGLGKVELEAAGQTVTRWVWLDKDQRLEVLFHDWIPPGPGAYEFKAGRLQRQVRWAP